MEERKVSVVKLGEFKLSDTSVLVINMTDYSGTDKIDFRVWENSPTYKGPTKKGFTLALDKMDEFMKMVSDIKSKIADVPRPERRDEKPARGESPAKKKGKPGPKTKK